VAKLPLNRLEKVVHHLLLGSIPHGKPVSRHNDPAWMPGGVACKRDWVRGLALPSWGGPQTDDFAEDMRIPGQNPEGVKGPGVTLVSRRGQVGGRRKWTDGTLGMIPSTENREWVARRPQRPYDAAGILMLPVPVFC